MNSDYYNSPHTHQIEGNGNYPEKLAFFVNSLYAIRQNHTPLSFSILDVGCHTGTMSVLFKKFGEVSGLDLNKKAVEEAKAKGIKAKMGNIFQVDTIFKNQLFDVVVAGDIIEHVFDTDLFLQKLKGMLKKNGTLLISTPNLLSLGRRLMALLGKNPYCEYSTKQDGINVGHIRYYTLDNLFNQLRENEFHRIRIQTDTANIPVRFIDRLLVRINPRLGRELYATAQK